MTGGALVLQGDARRLPLPDASVDLAISSPPYFNLRAYGAGQGEIGNERTPAEFLHALWEVTAELVRVVKPTGSIFINLGDSYARPGGGVDVSARSLNGAGKGFTARRPSPNRPGVREKSLLGLPWSYALGCTGQLAMLGGPDPGLNLILRAPIVLHKINGLPESVRDRVRTSDQEMLFHFVKQPRYYSALDELREPHTMRPQRRQNGHKERPKLGVLPAQTYSTSQREDLGVDGHPLGKLPGSVWTLASEPLRLPEWLGVQHYAAFSSELPRRVVLAFSPPGICVDCGQGRGPVVEINRVPHWKGGTNGGAGDGGGVGDRGHGKPRTNRADTILGYACSCTPYTNHPGTGEPSGTHGRYANAIEDGQGYANVAQGWPRGDSGHAGLGDRPKVGPWREYHLDGWKPPPTRPAIVLDPFSGVGTTIGVAKRLGRIGIGIDLSGPYCRAARWRVNNPDQFGKAEGRSWLARQGSLL